MHRDCFTYQFEISALNAQLKHYRCGLPYTYRYQKHPNAWSSIWDEKIIIIYLFGVEGNMFIYVLYFMIHWGLGDGLTMQMLVLIQGLLWTSISCRHQIVERVPDTAYGDFCAVLSLSFGGAHTQSVLLGRLSDRPGRRNKETRAVAARVTVVIRKKHDSLT